MHVIIFGANGNIGSRVTKICLEKGWKVDAFIRGAHSFNPNDNLSIIQGDIYDDITIQDAIQGQDVVISCLGSWGTPKKDILSTAMTSIVPTMESRGISRLVSLTGSDARFSSERIDFFNRIMHPIFSIIAPKIMHDGEEHMRIIAKSTLNWSIVRSPVMSNKGVPTYTLSGKRPRPWETIHRDAVATALVEIAANSQYTKSSPYIHRAS